MWCSDALCYARCYDNAVSINRLDELDQATLDELHLQCKSCMSGLALWLVAIECQHGIYSYQPYCTPCWDLVQGFVDMSHEEDGSMTVTFDRGHVCDATTWTGRKLEPTFRGVTMESAL